MMYNGGDNLYNQNFPQYDNGVYDRYNNMYLPCRKNMNCLKRCNCCLSPEEENCNKKANYILTENNRKIINKSAINRFKIVNKFMTDNSSYSNSQQILGDNDYRSATGKLNNRFKQFTRKNNENLYNNIYISLNPYGRNTYSNSNEMGNVSYNSNNKNSCVYGVNQINNNSNNDSTIYYIGNNTISNINYNKMFMKHKNKSQNYSNYGNQNYMINNLLYKDYTQNEVKSRVISPYNSEYREMEFGPITYRPENCAPIKPENHYKNEFITNFEKYQKQRNINNFTRHSKYYSSINNIELNKNENNAYKPLVNKNTNFKKIEHFSLNNRLMKRNIQNENRKKINLAKTMDAIQENSQNLILNKTSEIKNNKKINLADAQTHNNNFVEYNNHPLYELKSLPKDIVNHIQQKPKKVKNNNNIINSVSKKKSEDDLKRTKTDENMLKVKSNTNRNYKTLKEYETKKKDKLNLRERKINLTELNSCIRNEGKLFIKQKEKHKNASDINNQSEINNNKENINININFNESRGKNSSNNNETFSNFYMSKTETIKSESKIILKMDKDKNKFQNVNQIEEISDKNHKIITNNNTLKKDDNFKVEQPKPKVNCLQASISSINLEKIKSKPIYNKKSSISYISYVPSEDKKLSIKEVKKKKRKYSRQNVIQLNNIGKKSFEEDFPFNCKSDMSQINKILKSQIAFRTSLFAIKKPETEIYYIVNFFYSENIKKKPDVIESDF